MIKFIRHNGSRCLIGIPIEIETSLSLTLQLVCCAVNYCGKSRCYGSWSAVAKATSGNHSMW